MENVMSLQAVEIAEVNASVLAGSITSLGCDDAFEQQ